MKSLNHLKQHMMVSFTQIIRLPSATITPTMRAVKLTDIEAKVLTALRLDADQPLPLVAQHLRAKTTSVRHAFQSLLTRGAATPFYLVNLSPFGFLEYEIACRLQAKSDERRQEFFAFLDRCDEVTEVVEIGGDYSCIITVALNSPKEVNVFLEKITETFGPVLAKTSISLSLGYTLYPPKYLSSQSLIKSRRVDMVPVSSKLDTSDLELVRFMQSHPHCSERECARELKVSPSTLLYRLRRLREHGALLGRALMLRPETYGYSVFLFNVSLRTVSSKTQQRIDDFCLTHRNINYKTDMIGAWNYSIAFTVQRPSEATSLVNEFRDEFDDVIDDIKLFPIVTETKIGVSLSSSNRLPRFRENAA